MTTWTDGTTGFGQNIGQNGFFRAPPPPEPDTIVVNSRSDNPGDGFNDPNVTTLREAISIANEGIAGATITFDPTVFGGLNSARVTLFEGPLTIARSMTIDGDLDNDGIPDIIIDGDVAFDDTKTEDLLSDATDTPVRRQGFWGRWLPELREGLAHLVGLIMRRICGEASAGFRWSSV